MKITQSKLLLLIVVVLLSLKTQAQTQTYPDYVITVNGDSVPCRITYPSAMYGKMEYQDSTMAAPEKILEDRIKEYYVSDEQVLYRSVFINDAKKPVFLTVVEKGKINLFAVEVTRAYGTGFGRTNTTTEVDWYVSKGLDQVTDFKNGGKYAWKTKKERIDDFAPLLKDNPQVYNKLIADNDINFEEIRNIVHLYNTGEFFRGINTKDFLGWGRDYIVTPKNDTVFCRIKNDFFKGQFMYKPEKTSEFIVIDSSNTKEFFYSRDTANFALVNVPGQPKKEFLKQLEKGRVNLYQKNLILNDRDKKEGQSFWYINKGRDPLILIANRPNHGSRLIVKSAQLNAFYKTIADSESLLAAAKKAIAASDMGTEAVIRYFIKSYNDLYSGTGKPVQ